MKKLALALAATAMLAGTASAALADPVSTPIGTVAVNEGGDLVYADGYDTNPTPIGGFIQVKSSGQVCADDNGAKDDPSTPEPESSSPTCS